MKDRKLLLVAFLLSTTNYPLSTCLAQGDLTPPGPPAPTMKSLAQIEPRTPISSLPFVIGTGGSYYLTDNLTGVPGQDGISVGADNVTIDLGGFQLVGVTGASSGIAASSVRTNVVVRNGTVRDWPLFGVGTGNMVGGRYERLQLVRNGSGGLNVGNGSLALECVVVRSPTTGVSIGAITTGTASAVRNCVVKNSAGIGIQVGGGSTVSGCTVEATGGVSISAGVGCNVAGCVVNSGFGVAINCAQYSSLLDCTVSGNGSSGIIAGNGATIKNCTADSNTGVGIGVFDAATVQNCTARLNGNGGISGGNASIISGCTTVSNVNNGIVVGNGASVSQCTISGNLNGILTGTGCLILACASSLNSSNGVLAGDGSSIKNCTLAQNAASGVRATNNCLIAGNAGSYNALGLTTAASVYITGSDNEIVDNNVTHSGRGIKADSGFNLIVKNKATINDMDFDLVTGNKTGAISNDPTTAGPWANFSF